MINKLNKKWVIAGLIFIVSGYLIATIFRILTPPVAEIPKTPLITRNLDQSSSTFRGVQFTGQSPEIPEMFNVTQVAIGDVSRELQNQLEVAFSLVAKPGSDTLFLGPEYYLSLDKPTEWLLAKNSFISSETIIDLSRALEVATTFNDNTFKTKTTTTYAPGIIFLEADESHADQTTPEDANMVSIPFTTTIDGFPVFVENQNVFPAIYFISNNYQVEKITFNPLQIQLGTTTSAVPSISIETAVANLNQNQGAIIASTQTEFGEMNLSEIVSGELTEASIEYRVDQALSLAYPFYRFKGAVQNANGTDLTVEIITPAVATRAQ